MADSATSELPFSLTIDIPFATPRLASVALQALRVDKELSSLVRRTFSQTTPGAGADGENGQEEATLLRAEYRAATNRMLRVAVNSFMDSLALVIEVMEQLDVDVLAQAKAL